MTTAWHPCPLWLLAATLTAVHLGLPVAVQAQTPENVGVLINESSAASVLVGEHYVRARGIPAANVFRIRTDTDDTIERDAFVSTIQQPLARAIAARGLQDRLLYLVLTKGVPLRIAGTTGLEGTMSSVDSELTLLYRRMTGQLVGTAGPIANPYFLGTRDVGDAGRFTRRAYDIYLVSRLDAFTPVEAMELVNKALAPVTDGQILLHQRGSLAANALGDGWLAAAAKWLQAEGHGERVVFDTARNAPTASAPVLGYYSWGSTDPALRTRELALRFVPGALAATFVGTSARTFTAPPPEWRPTESADRSTWYAGASQALVGDLIREGATGVSGYVAEPYLQGAVRPDILFPAYLTGFNLVEAFYLAMPVLSWQSVIIGDPLCAPFQREAVAPSDIDGGIDSRTEHPTFFGARRLEIAVASVDAAEDVAAHIVRAEARMARGDVAGVRQALEAASRGAPDMAALHNQLAMLALQTGNRDEVVARYRQVLRLQPDDALALNNLAFALADRGAPAEARPLAARAVELTSRNPAVLDTLGWIEYLLGNHEEAAQLLREASAGAPAVPSIRLNAAFALAAAGDLAVAREHLQEAVRLNPELASRPDVQQLQHRLVGTAQ